MGAAHRGGVGINMVCKVTAIILHGVVSPEEGWHTQYLEGEVRMTPTLASKGSWVGGILNTKP